MKTSREHVGFNVPLLVKDMALRGLSPAALARRAGVADMTAYRFLRGESQSTATAKKFAEALGKSPGRYLVFPSEARAS